jgi:DNA-directed RNA polymerase specialized sigma24 family protein
MSEAQRHRLAAHLQRHARRLHAIACGFGRRRDADDVIQILYARWWRRLLREPAWSPPEDAVALFVCVKRVVIDELGKWERRPLREAGPHIAAPAFSPEEGFHAFQRLDWILGRLPAQSAEVLMASLSAGRRRDTAVASELGLTHRAYTARLFHARRAAEQLATYYEQLAPDLAELMAQLCFGGRTRAQIAHELGLLPDELEARRQQALAVLEENRGVAAL